MAEDTAVGRIRSALAFGSASRASLAWDLPCLCLRSRLSIGRIGLQDSSPAAGSLAIRLPKNEIDAFQASFHFLAEDTGLEPNLCVCRCESARADKRLNLGLFNDSARFGIGRQRRSHFRNCYQNCYQMRTRKNTLNWYICIDVYTN